MTIPYKNICNHNIAAFYKNLPKYEFKQINSPKFNILKVRVTSNRGIKNLAVFTEKQ